jgi:DNA-binding CsgD family transcriptional regulator
MAMVFVHDPLRAAPASVALLQSVFGLTPAEADLARALHAGTSPARHARDRAVSVNTVYTHLRRLKEKTGTTRLAELTNLIDKLSPPLR